jgi:hypothetical protein
MDLRIEPAAVRRAAGELQRHGTGLAAAGWRAAAGEGGRIWGDDPLGAPFGAAYPGVRDAVLAQVQALTAMLAGTGHDLAGIADRTERADAESAAAFRREA